MIRLNIKTINRAKKRHICSWCGDPILPGESYNTYFTGTAVRLHKECMSAMSDYSIATCSDSGVDALGENNRGCNCFKDPECEVCG